MQRKMALRKKTLSQVTLPRITPRPKILSLLKEVTFKNRSRRTKLRTFPRDFKRLWSALRPHRIGFKPFDFYYPFLSLLPYPFPTYDTYFRLQSRTFIFWYEFAARKYNITFDFGIKQKKTATETAVWQRSTRRGASPVYSWWAHWRRNSTFRNFEKKFLKLNSNSQQPFFFVNKAPGLLWFEETLPQARRSAWNFYSRLSTFRSELFSLSQSIFDKRLFSRKAPTDSTTFWLASPVHDYSAFVKNYSTNKSMVLPERFFQFRREREYLANYWSQSFYRLWTTGFGKQSTFAFDFHLPKLLFYGKTRLAFFLFSSLFFTKPTILSFWEFLRAKPLEVTVSRGVALGRSANSHWFSRILPTPSRKNKSRIKFRTVAFFLKRSFFLRHLRRKLFRRPQNVSFSLRLSGRVRRLNYLLSLFFQLYSFDAPFRHHQLFYLFFAILNHEWLASNLRGRYLALRPSHRFHQKKRIRRPYKPRRVNVAKLLAVAPPRPRKKKGRGRGRRPFVAY